MGKFYVYSLCRPDGNVFYIGKGQGKRIDAHETEARSGHVCYKCNVIRKVWRLGGQIQKDKLLETDDEREALDYEIELIAQFGRDTLTNQTDGGDGARSLPDDVRIKRNLSIQTALRSAESHAKLSAAQKAAWSRRPERHAEQSRMLKAAHADPEIKAKHSNALKVAQSTPEAKARLSARGKAQSPETRAKLRAAMKARSPEMRATVGAAVKATMATPEAKARRSAALKAWYAGQDDDEAAERRAGMAERTRAKWDDPTYREKVLAARAASTKTHGKRRAQTRERIEVRRTALKAHWQAPDYHAKMRQAMRAKWEDPEYRERVMAARARKKAG